MRAFVALGLLLAALPASARTLVVHPGQSIRAAIGRAAAGDRIQVLPGIYREGARPEASALTITQNGIEPSLAPPTTRPCTWGRARTCSSPAIGVPRPGSASDPFPTNDRIVGNRLKQNGLGNFRPDFPLAAFQADLTWDGSGTGNCWSDNQFTTSAPSELPGCK